MSGKDCWNKWCFELPAKRWQWLGSNKNIDQYSGEVRRCRENQDQCGCRTSGNWSRYSGTLRAALE